ncbi:MAG TPA: TetR/AcrR family transcriptional regulator, partial [Acidimicrobiales bacterium]|nr:TetR/AcrR family transcriptional regulator [Acidimicrobiales bacterium]
MSVTPAACLARSGIRLYTRPVDRAAVVEAGAAIARSAGIEGVGVRPVAGRLGVTPMALYRHVDDAADLRAAVVARALEEVPDVPAEGPWDLRCRTWAHGTRAVVAGVPGLARLVLLDWTRHPRLLVVVDRLATMLAEDGPDGVDPLAGANAVFTYVLARAQAEETVRVGGVERPLAALDALAD